MFKNLALATLFTLAFGTSFASFMAPAHAAIDSYMCFLDYDDNYLDGESD